MLTVIQYYIIIKIKKTKTSRKDLKKEGIMRINSYNKFFAELAKIMNTSVKAVEQLDGRYKVELANHVYLNVYRGVGGSLFIHDYRGIARITSCYDFEDFKTMKDLYERLVSDYSESAKKEVMEVKQELNRRFGKDQYFDTDDLQVHKQMKAKSNPEWHHVSLATLANIDLDKLDEKRKLVRDINHILKDGIRNLYKCENHISFEVLERYVIRKCDEFIRHNRLKVFWFSYIARQLDEVRRNTSYLYTPYITAHRNRW
jgi:hypothetical protein